MKDLDYTFGHCTVYCDDKDCNAEEEIDGFSRFIIPDNGEAQALLIYEMFRED